VLLELTVGPLPDPAQADNLVELFKEITDLGTIEPLDGGRRRRHAPLQGRHHQQRRRPAGPVHLPRRARAGAAGAARRRATAFHDGAPGAPEKTRPPRPGLRLLRRRPRRAGRCRRVPGRTAAAAPASGRRAPAAKPAARRRQAEKAAGGRISTLRVSVEKVDQLINLVGELVITQAMLAQNSRNLDAAPAPAAGGGLADLERNTRDLQEAVMSIRMIPMSVVFNRFPRMLRDLAAKLGKKVELVTVGEATELDKGLVEKITDPLTHLVRNSCDHGIEMPAERLAKGKPEHGTDHAGRPAPGRQHRHRGARRRQGPEPRASCCQGAREGHRRPDSMTDPRSGA
jgi:two-component system chemotaxis sensor kinase CheA